MPSSLCVVSCFLLPGHLVITLSISFHGRCASPTPSPNRESGGRMRSTRSSWRPSSCTAVPGDASKVRAHTNPAARIDVSSFLLAALNQSSMCRVTALRLTISIMVSRAGRPVAQCQTWPVSVPSTCLFPSCRVLMCREHNHLFPPCCDML